MPTKETQLYHHIKQTMAPYGSVFRIETVNGAFPDLAYMSNGHTIWIEGKMSIGKNIKHILFDKHQIAFAQEASKHLLSWQFLVAVNDTGTPFTSIYTFKHLRQFMKPLKNNVRIDLQTALRVCMLPELPSYLKNLMAAMQIGHTSPSPFVLKDNV